MSNTLPDMSLPDSIAQESERLLEALRQQRAHLFTVAEVMYIEHWSFKLRFNTSVESETQLRDTLLKLRERVNERASRLEGE